jgi:hypothetical protein
MCPILGKAQKRDMVKLQVGNVNARSLLTTS